MHVRNERLYQVKLYVWPEMRSKPSVGKVRAGAQTSIVLDSAARAARAQTAAVRKATNFMVDKADRQTGWGVVIYIYRGQPGPLGTSDRWKKSFQNVLSGA